MKTLLSVVFGSLTTGLLAANVFYVDAVNGNDGWDGSTPEIPTQEVIDAGGTIPGPRQTLVGIMEKVTPTTKAATEGDTVWVAEGTYGNKTYDAGSGILYRAFVPNGCRLIGSGRKEKTFIVGAASTDPSADANGCGPGAVKCLKAGSWVYIKNVTICGGRAPAFSGTQSAEDCAAAAVQGGSYLVDCVVSNIWATNGRGGALRGPGAIRCYFADIKGYAIGNVADTCSAFFNCVIDESSGNSYALYSTTPCNCTFVGTGGSSRSVRGLTCYNDLLFRTDGGNGNKFFHCVLRAAISSQSTASNGTQVAVGEAKSRLDADFTPVKGFNVGIDAGTNEIYAAKFPTDAFLADQKDLDFLGNPRINRGRIDVGAVEYDWAKGFSADLASARVTVTAFSDSVYENADGKVALPDGAELTLVWQRPADAPAAVEHTFVVELAEGATLAVYRDGAAEPVWTLAESQTVAYDAVADETLRFVAAGGEAVISRFYDCGTVDVTDASTGLTMTGVTVGHNEVAPGTTVGFSRNFTSEYTLKGILANGEYVSFEDHADGWTWEYTVNGPSSSLTVEAVYATTKDWFVDAVNGDDENDGRTPSRAKKTLVAAVGVLAEDKTRKQPKTQTVYVAEGIYDEGVYTNGATGLFRTYVPCNTRLVATGRKEKTIIRGAASTAPDADERGNGTDAVRGVLMGTDSHLIGFTVTGGRSPAAASSGGVYGAAAACIVDCIVTNNSCLGNNGGAVYNVTALRCYFSDNYAAHSAVYSSKVVNSLFGPNSSSQGGGSDMYFCTYVRGSSRNGSTYDSLLLGTVNGCDNFYNCLCAKGITDQYSTADATTRLNLGTEVLACDENYVPLADSLQVNYGRDDCYRDVVQGLTDGFVDPYGDLDFSIDYNHNPRIVGGHIDVGACEYDWRKDPPPGLAVSTEDLGEGRSRVFIALAESADSPCVGFTLGETTVRFADHEPGYVWTTELSTAEITAFVFQPIYGKDWYVDAVNGNDASRGYLPNMPMKTLAAVMAKVEATYEKLADIVVHAAPGTYGEGEMTPAGNTTNRVYVSAGVSLVADEGSEKTMIVGRFSETSGIHNGPDAIRCCYCERGAVVRGFTLTGGAVAQDGKYGSSGGGAYGNGTLIDCVITNNYAVRGGGASGVTLIRCQVTDNAYENFGTATSGTAKDFHSGSAYFSLLGSAWGGKIVGCTCLDSAFGSVKCINSLLYWDGGGIVCSNCVLAAAPHATNPSTFDRNCQTNVSPDAVAYDANLRPLSAAGATVDAGIWQNILDHWPAEFIDELGVDYAGGPRIYNGKVDIGPGEYDWRGDFAKTLAKRGVEVTAAGADVTTNLTAGLDVPAGESLRLKLVLKTDGRVSFKVVAEGGAAVTVTVGGEPVAPGEGGKVEFEALAGETEVEIDVTGEDKAVVSDVVLPKLGVLLIVR